MSDLFIVIGFKAVDLRIKCPNPNFLIKVQRKLEMRLRSQAGDIDIWADPSSKRNEKD